MHLTLPGGYNPLVKWNEHVSGYVTKEPLLGWLGGKCNATILCVWLYSYLFYAECDPKHLAFLTSDLIKVLQRLSKSPKSKTTKMFTTDPNSKGTAGTTELSSIHYRVKVVQILC